jgi:hypothetical protein
VISIDSLLFSFSGLVTQCLLLNKPVLTAMLARFVQSVVIKMFLLQGLNFQFTNEKDCKFMVSTKSKNTRLPDEYNIGGDASN